MKCASWVWSFASCYPGVQNDDTKLPISTVVLKTHEASVWFSQAQITGFAQIYREQGIDLEAWCVPLGYVDDVGNAVTVLNMMREAGIAEPWLQFDFESEPTDDFWKGTPDQVWNIYTEVKRQCPWAHLSMCLYQYEPALGFINTGAHPAMERFETMDYFSQFGTTPEARLAYSLTALAPYNKPVRFGLPGNAPADEMVRALAWLAPRGGLEISPVIWRRGTTTRAVWDAIDAYALTPPPPPEPPPPRPDAILTLLGEMVERDTQDVIRAQVRLDADRARLLEAMDGEA